MDNKLDRSNTEGAVKKGSELPLFFEEAEVFRHLSDDAKDVL